MLIFILFYLLKQRDIPEVLWAYDISYQWTQVWSKSNVNPIQVPKMREHDKKPKKIRKKGQDVTPIDSKKLPRLYSKYNYTKCKQFRHNAINCKRKTKVNREITNGGTRQF